MTLAAYTKLGPVTLLTAACLWSLTAAGCRSEREAENAAVSNKAEAAAPSARPAPDGSVTAPRTLQTAAPLRADRTLMRADAPPAASAGPTQRDADLGKNVAPEDTEGEHAAPPGSRLLSVAVLGDSLSDERVGGGGYLDAVRRACPSAHIDNFAIGGYMVNQIRRRFVEHVLTQPSGTYSHVIVFGGVNDLYSDITAGRSVAKITADLAFIYAESRRLGAHVIAITVTPWGGFTRYYNARRAAATQRLNAWILEQTRDGAVDFAVDAYPLLSCGARQRLCPELAAPFHDGIHFGRKGQQRLGEALVEAAFSDCR